MKWTPGRLKFVLNIYPPYLFAGVRVTKIDPEWRELHVSMKLHWFNQNAVGTHFGGSIYSMVDPHLMLLLMQALGSGYVVWDKSAEIEFIKPGKGRVHSVVRITDDELEEIRRKTAAGDVYRPQFELAILDEQGDIVARVTKVLHIRCRRSARSA
ncbi:MAG: YiiD C-terminal domain-containing protein [Anaerolineales bacterium]|nr:YiiD C-terminal domain-containing protein [Anaerolineales bacterium]MCK5633818.1 YiiD C-terminal domain-containing protein [Anaerolineales bacterium]